LVLIIGELELISADEAQIVLRRMKQKEAGEIYVIRILIVFTARVELLGR
jgi:hypothetical protein